MPGGYRNWCWTLNNPTEEERSLFAQFELNEDVQYMIFQEESGENGTVHFQGYLELKKQHDIRWLKVHFNARAHYESRRGTQQEAIDYCKKTESRVEGGMSGEFGQPKGANQGKTAAERREERIKSLDGLRNGTIRLRDVDSETLMNAGFLQAAKTILSTKLGPRRSVRVITIIGGTGIGKSHACYDICKENLITYKSGGWFAGADTQADNLLFDEFAGQVPLADFLQLLDGYPNSLPVKGSFYPAHYTTVFITSNIMPHEWYTTRGPSGEELEKRHGQLEALYRRIGYAGPGNENIHWHSDNFIYIEFSGLNGRVLLHEKLRKLGFEIEDN